MVASSARGSLTSVPGRASVRVRKRWPAGSTSRSPRRSWCRSPRPAAWPTWAPRCPRRWRSWATASRCSCRATGRSPSRRGSSRARSTCRWTTSTAAPASTAATLAEACDVVFVEHPPFFDRPYPYGVGNDDYADNRLRFAFFSRAVLEYFRSRGERPDVFHAHDWQTGLVPVYLKSFYWDDPDAAPHAHASSPSTTWPTRGTSRRDTLSMLGLPWNLGDRDALEFHGGISYMKGGILFSEMRQHGVAAVRAGDPDARDGLRASTGILRARAADLSGILNGVDYDEWDPADDPHIARALLGGRPRGQGRRARPTCCATFGLPAQPDLPVVGIISRLVAPEGLRHRGARPGTTCVQRPLRMVVLGTGEPAVQDGFRALAERAPRTASRCASPTTTALAHKIEAGRRHVPDAVALRALRPDPDVQPALRHGARSCARPAGSSTRWSPTTARPAPAPASASTRRTAPGMMWAIDQALATYGTAPAWQRLMRNGMARDFSWERSAARVRGRSTGRP